MAMKPRHTKLSVRSREEIPDENILLGSVTAAIKRIHTAKAADRIPVSRDMKNITRRVRDDRQKNVVRSFRQLCQRHTRWTVWSDFVMMAAIEISNAVDHANAVQRSETYRNIAKRYNAAEHQAFGEMLTEIVLGMDENVEQDFLGELFMALELGNDHSGQFFTPYEVCKLMAGTSSTDLKERIEKDHWISVNDCACGAGALLLAFANECSRQEVNYQTSVLFTAQDVDLISGCMCYIQLSLLGCPGYVVIGNTITSPSTSYDRRGLLPRGTENVWYTPLYFTDTWHYRKLFAQLDLMCRSAKEAPVEVEIQAHLKTTETGQLTLF